jgi:hypothetical protein
MAGAFALILGGSVLATRRSATPPVPATDSPATDSPAADSPAAV